MSRNTGWHCTPGSHTHTPLLLPDPPGLRALRASARTAPLLPHGALQLGRRPERPGQSHTRHQPPRGCGVPSPGEPEVCGQPAAQPSQPTGAQQLGAGTAGGWGGGAMAGLRTPNEGTTSRWGCALLGWNICPIVVQHLQGPAWLPSLKELASDAADRRDWGARDTLVAAAMEKFRAAIRQLPEFDRGCYNLGTVFYTFASAQTKEGSGPGRSGGSGGLPPQANGGGKEEGISGAASKLWLRGWLGRLRMQHVCICGDLCLCQCGCTMAQLAPPDPPPSPSSLAHRATLFSLLRRRRPPAGARPGSARAAVHSSAVHSAGSGIPAWQGCIPQEVGLGWVLGWTALGSGWAWCCTAGRALRAIRAAFSAIWHRLLLAAALCKGSISSKSAASSSSSSAACTYPLLGAASSACAQPGRRARHAAAALPARRLHHSTHRAHAGRAR